MMTVKQASLVHLILTHLKCDHALREGVAASTEIPNFEFVIDELMEAVGHHMVGPVA